jgi:arginase
MSTIELIGVPFDGYGRPDNQSHAAAALRAVGLAAAFRGREIVVKPDTKIPAQSGERAPKSGLMNEPAVIAMADALRADVCAGLSEGHFPFVYGADGSVLLGAVPGLRDTVGEAGLVFLDGHEAPLRRKLRRMEKWRTWRSDCFSASVGRECRRHCANTYPP